MEMANRVDGSRPWEGLSPRVLQLISVQRQFIEIRRGIKHRSHGRVVGAVVICYP